MKNGGVKGTDGSAEELDRETGERVADDRLLKRGQSYVSRAGGDEGDQG